MLYPVPNVFVACVVARAIDALENSCDIFATVFLAFVALRTTDAFVAVLAAEDVVALLRGLVALRETFCCTVVLLVALRLTVFPALRAVDEPDVRVVVCELFVLVVCGVAVLATIAFVVTLSLVVRLIAVSLRTAALTLSMHKRHISIKSKFFFITILIMISKMYF